MLCTTSSTNSRGTMRKLSSNGCDTVLNSHSLSRRYEATEAVKNYLEPMGLYNYDPTPVPLAMWKVARECHYIEGYQGVQYYKSLPSKTTKKSD